MNTLPVYGRMISMLCRDLRVRMILAIRYRSAPGHYLISSGVPGLPVQGKLGQALVHRQQHSEQQQGPYIAGSQQRP